MILVPAIDVLGGRVVRLVRGRPGTESVYSDDPARVAQAFARGGAGLLHVVDLDAALGTGDNREAIAGVIRASGVAVQVGGGLRTLAAVGAMVEAGAARVVVGTEAVADPGFLEEAVASFGDRVVAALDTDGRRVLVQGWTEAAGPLEAVLGALEAAGAPRFLVTAVARDGTLGGPDLALYRRVAALTDRPVLASGGVRHAGDLRALAATGVEGAVVGRALHEGALSLADALAAAGTGEGPG